MADQIEQLFGLIRENEKQANEREERANDRHTEVMIQMTEFRSVEEKINTHVEDHRIRGYIDKGLAAVAGIASALGINYYKG